MVYWSGAIRDYLALSDVRDWMFGVVPGGNSLCLDRERVMILSLVGTIRSPLTCV
jgi:hypothetical protein